MNRLTRIASAMLIALVFVVLAACTATDPRLEDESTIPAALAELAGAPARAERFVIVSGADVTLAADESVDLFVVYNGTARIEGHASSVVVVNGTANLVGGQRRQRDRDPEPGQRRPELDRRGRHPHDRIQRHRRDRPQR